MNTGLIKLQSDRIMHQFRNMKSRYNLKNKDVSIISSNCIGGVIYHDLNLKFFSPTINLFFDPENFIRYVKDLKFYNGCAMENVSGDSSYPIGKLEDVEIHFLHYKSFEEAVECWEKRKKRIHYNNLVVIMTDQGVSSDDIIKEFDKISFPKVYLTNKHFSYSWAEYISGFDECKWLGNTIEYDKGWLGKRYYEQFDYVSFLNSAK